MLPPDPAPAVESVRAALSARAAGLWARDGEVLRLLAFAPAPDLDPAVAAQFASATASVPLDRVDLGIVGAATRREVVVAEAAELPADAGSGFWLRAFGADRSVAVPVFDAPGGLVAVASVAVADDGRSWEEIAGRIRSGFPGG